MQILPTPPKQPKQRRNKEIVLFILFFVFATLLWFGHAMQSVRTTSVAVRVHYVGKPGEIGLDAEGLPEMVMIDVHDIGYRLKDYHQNLPQITIDLHQYIHGDSGTIQIPANDLRGSIKAVLKDNSKLVETHPEEIHCGYFKEQSKEVTVVFEGAIQMADGYQIVGVPHWRKTISIYGKQSILDSIDALHTERVVFSNLNSDLHAKVAFVIPQCIRAECDSLSMNVLTEQYTEKQFTSVPVIKRNVPEGYEMILLPHETVEVNVRIGMDHYADLKESDIKVYCDYPLLPKEKLALQLDYSANPHITSAWVYPAEIEYVLDSVKPNSY